MLDKEILRIELDTKAADKAIESLDKKIEHSQKSAKKGLDIKVQSDTRDLKKQLNDIQKGATVKVGVNLDLSKITTELKKLQRAINKTPVEIPAHISLKDLGKDIKKIQSKLNKTKLTAEVTLDTKELEKQKFEVKDTVKVDLEVNTSFAEKTLKDFSTKADGIKVGVVLDSKKTRQQLNDFVKEAQEKLDVALRLGSDDKTIKVIATPPQDSRDSQKVRQDNLNQPKSGKDSQSSSFADDLYKKVRQQVDIAKASTMSQAKSGKGDELSLVENLSNIVREIQQKHATDLVAEYGIKEGLAQLKPFGKMAEEVTAFLQDAQKVLAESKTKRKENLKDKLEVTAVPPKNSGEAIKAKQIKDSQPVAGKTLETKTSAGKSGADLDTLLKILKTERATAKRVITSADKKGTFKVPTLEKQLANFGATIKELGKFDDAKAIAAIEDLEGIQEKLLDLLKQASGDEMFDERTKRGKNVQNLKELNKTTPVNDLFKTVKSISEFDVEVNQANDAFQKLANTVLGIVYQASRTDDRKGKPNVNFVPEKEAYMSSSARGVNLRKQGTGDSSIHLREDLVLSIAKSLKSGEILRDDLKTLLHEPRHAMQVYAENAGQSFNYLEPKNAREIKEAEKTATYSKDPRTQRMEKDAFVFAERYVDAVAKKLNLKVIDSVQAENSLETLTNRFIVASKQLAKAQAYLKATEGSTDALTLRRRAFIEKELPKHQGNVDAVRSRLSKEVDKANQRKAIDALPSLGMYDEKQSLSSQLDAQAIDDVLTRFILALNQSFDRFITQFSQTIASNFKGLGEMFNELPSDSFDEFFNQSQKSSEGSQSEKPSQSKSDDSQTKDDTKQKETQLDLSPEAFNLLQAMIKAEDGFSIAAYQLNQAIKNLSDLDITDFVNQVLPEAERTKQALTPDRVNQLIDALKVRTQEIEDSAKQTQPSADELKRQEQRINQTIENRLLNSFDAIIEESDNLARTIAQEEKQRRENLRPQDGRPVRERLEANIRANALARRARSEALEGRYQSPVSQRAVNRLFNAPEGELSLVEETNLAQRLIEAEKERTQEALRRQQIERQTAREALMANLEASRSVRAARNQAQENNLYGNPNELGQSDQARARVQMRLDLQRRVAAEREAADVAERSAQEELATRRRIAGLHASIEDSIAGASRQRDVRATQANQSQNRATNRAIGNVALNSIEMFNNSLGNGIRLITEFHRDISEAQLAGENFIDTLSRLRMPLGLLGLGAVIGGLVAVTAPTVLEFQKLEKSLEALNVNLPSDGLENIKQVALETGANISDLTTQFAKFTTANVDTSLETQSSRIFNSLAEYGAVIGATQDELNRGFIALQQISAKGRVSLEELNGQLSEAIPGASNLAARGMGITRREMFALATEGNLLATDLLPKLADQLERVSRRAKKSSVPILSQEFAKLAQKVTLLGVALTETPLNVVAKALASLNKEVGGLNISTTVGMGLFSLLTSTFLVLAGSIATTALAAIGFTSVMAALTAVFGTLMTTVLPLTAAVVALSVALDNYSGGESFRQSVDVFKDAANSVREYRMELESALAKLEELANKQTDTKPPDQRGTRFLNQKDIDKFEQQSSTFFGRVQQAAGGVTRNARDIFKPRSNLKERAKSAARVFGFGRTPNDDLQQLDRQKGIEVVKSVDENRKLLDIYSDLVAEVKAYNKAKEEGTAIAEGDFLQAKALEEYQTRMKSLVQNTEDLQTALSAIKTVAIDDNFVTPAAKFQEIMERLGDIEQTNPGLLSSQGFDFATVRSAEDLTFEINKILGQTQAEIESVKIPVDLEGARNLRDQITKSLEDLPDNSPAAENLKLQLKEVNQVLLEGADLLEQQANIIDYIGLGAKKIKRISEESKTRTSLASSYAEALLTQKALEGGAMDINSLAVEKRRIQAATHAANMKALKDEIALTQKTSLEAIPQKDVQKLRAILGDSKAFVESVKDGVTSVSFDITKATQAELNKILNTSPDDLAISESLTQFISQFRDERVSDSEAFVQAFQGLNEIQFDIRAQAKEKAQEFEDRVGDIFANMGQSLEDSIKSFDGIIQAIDRQVEDIQFEIESLDIKSKFRKSRASLDEALSELPSDNPFNLIGETVRSLLDNQEEKLNSELELQTNQISVQREFEDGVKQIEDAFDAYLKTFNDFQKQLLEANQEKEKADREAASFNVENLQGLAADLSIIDSMSLDDLTSAIADQTLKNEVISSKQTDALLKQSQKLVDEAKSSQQNESIQTNYLAQVASSSQAVTNKLDNLKLQQATVQGLDPLVVLTTQIRDKLTEICGYIKENGYYESRESGDGEQDNTRLSRPSLADSQVALKAALAARQEGIAQQDKAIKAYASSQSSSYLERDAAINDFLNGADAISKAEEDIRKAQDGLKAFGVNLEILGKESTAARKFIADGFEAFRLREGGYSVLETKQARDAGAFQQQQTQDREIPYDLLQKIGNLTGFSTMELREKSQEQLSTLAKKAKVDLSSYLPQAQDSAVTANQVTPSPVEAPQMVSEFVQRASARKEEALAAQELLATEKQRLNQRKAIDVQEIASLANSAAIREGNKQIAEEFEKIVTANQELADLQTRFANPALNEFVTNRVRSLQDEYEAYKQIYENQLKQFDLSEEQLKSARASLEAELLKVDLTQTQKDNIKTQLDDLESQAKAQAIKAASVRGELGSLKETLELRKRIAESAGIEYLTRQKSIKDEQRRLDVMSSDPFLNPSQKTEFEKRRKELELEATRYSRAAEIAEEALSMNPSLDLDTVLADTTAQLEKLDRLELSNFSNTLDTVANKLKNTVGDTLTNLFTLDFTGNLGEQLINLFSQGLKDLQSWAGTRISEYVSSMLFGSKANEEDIAREKANDITSQATDIAQATTEASNKVTDTTIKVNNEATDKLVENNKQNSSKIANAVGFAAGGAALVGGLASGNKTAVGSGIGSILGGIIGGFTGLGVQNGMMLGGLLGGGAAQMFAQGGAVVANQSSMSIADALAAERLQSGRQPVLAVLHEGEQVLSTKNKDAQAFQALEKHGIWDSLKGNIYAKGGTVGKAINLPGQMTTQTSNRKEVSNSQVNNFNIMVQPEGVVPVTKQMQDARRRNFFM